MKHLSLTIFAFFMAIAAFAQCNPQFTYSPTPFNNDLLNVSFTNTTNFTGNSNSFAYYVINYGDGIGDYIADNASHSYAAPGSYSVVLSMYVYETDSANTPDSTTTLICSSSDTQTVTVGYTPCGTSISSYVVSQTNSSEIIDFSALTPAGTSGMSYTWSFGDGTSATGATVSHTYNTIGEYTITLTATSSNGCSYTNSTDVTIDVMDCSMLSADFSANNAYYSTVYFGNNSSSLTIGLDTSLFQQYAIWTFGDGSSSTDYNAQHTYATAGTYTVTLTNMWVGNNPVDTCMHTATQSVTVGDPAPPPSIISGNLVFDANTFTDSSFYYKVWLIKFDASTNTLYAVDSISDYYSIYGNYYLSYAFNNVPTGLYRTKAQVLYNSIPANGLIPTYDSTSLYWSDAWVINHTDSTITENVKIYMQSGTVTSGPGFIGGDVTQGANKGTAADGVAGMNIYLRNAANNVITYAVTDANGHYAFSNIPNGTYSIYPEALNYATAPYTSVTLSANNETAAAISFIQHTVSKTITPVTTAVASVSKDQDVSIYPNPASGVVNITWQNGNFNAAHVVVSDAVGRKVSESVINVNANSGIQSINVSSLKDGIYFISITADNYNKTQKLVIQH